jgi:UDP-4-amino-4,6-dideoxy-N-acetyl-beta-L-altrosamine transaminase
MKGQLALHGGKPVRQILLPYGRQRIDEADIAAVGEVLRGDWLTQGPTVTRFEEAFAAKLGVRHAVAFANGTAALHGACFAAGITSGQEVVVPAITFAATANAALYLGATPVFADVDPASGLLSPDDLRKKITPRTKALLPVHYAGLPVDMAPLRDLAERHGLVVIEDACHALGATYRGVPAGRLGDLACFSFHPVKHITTGEGGMVVTDDDAYAEKLRLFRTHGIGKDPARVEAIGDWHYDMVHLGFNYRLTDFQAALGLSQLRKLDRFVAERQAHAAAYDQAFADMPGVSPLRVPADRTCSYHLYPLLFDMARLSCDKKTLFAALRAEGIGVQVHYIPVPRQPYYRTLGYDPAATPGAEEFFAREISLPLFVGLTDADRHDVLTAVRKVVDALGR